MSRHWAGGYIGRSYESCGGCWGLVRRVFSERFGIDMPLVAIGTEELQAPAILAASQASGWRPAPAPVQERDILLMRHAAGERHVGVAVAANGAMGLLHCTDVRGAEWTALDVLPSAGYTEIECWRLA